MPQRECEFWKLSLQMVPRNEVHSAYSVLVYKERIYREVVSGDDLARSYVTKHMHCRYLSNIMTYYNFQIFAEISCMMEVVNFSNYSEHSFL